MASALSSTFSAAATPLSRSSSVVTAARNARAGRVNSGRIGVVSCSQSSASSSSSSSEKHEEKWVASRRDMVAGIGLSAIFAGGFALPAFALLEADDDESLLEKVKEDRKKRIEKRAVVRSFKGETESVQKAVYELSKAGQAIDGEDYGILSTVLGSNAGWINEVKAAIEKVNRSAEEEGEAANFSAALQALQSAVSKKDLESSKSAFVASGSALEKWASLTGIVDQIKGL